MASKREYIRVQVSGESENLWKELRGKLVLTINKFLDTTIDHRDNSSIREEAQKFTSALIDHAKAKLQKSGLENDKLLAEIDELYTRRQKEIAETRKINAEANAIEFETAVSKLKLSLGMTKAMMLGQPGEDDMLFVRQIDSFLEILDDFKHNRLT